MLIMEINSPCEGACARVGVYNCAPGTPDGRAEVARLELLGILAREDLSEEVLRPLYIRL